MHTPSLRRQRAAVEGRLTPRKEPGDSNPADTGTRRMEMLSRLLNSEYCAGSSALVLKADFGGKVAT